jgi:D-amino-acid dehydrogenase
LSLQKVTIVGAGITGMFVAYYLRKAGYDVTLVDRDSVGREASVYNAGLITPSFAPAPQFSRWGLLKAVLVGSGPLYISPREILSHSSWYRIASRKALSGFEGPVLKLGQKSLELYREFFESEDIRADIVRGVLGLYRYRTDAEAFCKQFGGELLEPGAIRQMGFRGLDGGVLLESEYSVNPSKMFNELRQRLSKLGANLLLGKDAGLELGKPRAECLVDGVPIESDLIVVAAGSWTQGLLSEGRFQSQVLPARGLVLIYDTKGRVVAPKPVLLEDYGVAVVQHDQNTLRVTSFFEMVGFKRGFSDSRKRWLADIVGKHVTDVRGLQLLEEGVGFRPCTPDQFPVVGKLPSHENLYVATGNCRLGLTLAPATACLLRSEIEGSEFMEEIKRLVSPARFSG